MFRRQEKVFLSPVSTDESGHVGRLFYAEELGFGTLQQQDDNGLGNLVAHFDDVHPLEGETSVVAGMRFDRNPAVVLDDKSAITIISRAAKAVREG